MISKVLLFELAKNSKINIRYYIMLMININI